MSKLDENKTFYFVQTSIKTFADAWTAIKRIDPDPTLFFFRIGLVFSSRFGIRMCTNVFL